MKSSRLAFAVALLGLLCSVPSFAGPPYLTDDPDPVPYRHWEFYTFLTQDRTRSTNTVNGPAFELNNGVAPNTQIHLIVPVTYFSDDGMIATGLGDIELGVKYRLLAETRARPEVGMFPLLELPTGDQSKGLGNGRTWTKIPLWLEKNWGPWQSYGGGGYAYNPAPGQRNYFFGGLLVQRTLSPKLSLGGELFFQGAQVKNAQPTSGDEFAPMMEIAGARSSQIWNLGGIYNFTTDFSLLFTAGHSFHGEGNQVLYVGLYRTWGPGSP